MFSNMSFGILSMIYIVFLMWAFFRKVHIQSLELRELYIEYIEMRKSINKPITKRGLKMLINRCERLANFSIKEQKTMLEASIINNWCSVYLPNEIKQDREEEKQRHIEDLKSFYLEG